ncbi:hypothetical protein PRUPE_3G179500 [Prunus persica]|uniref:Reticulon-like protein n=1 Tax=Prunus persica TaxID=3760 RepID=A0A251Q1T1_PRUPE|nr:reticulon-like protein B8 isoform X2 [Prunus persica]ONI17796.1 hypothetical protein PRUPE_3G179500 [Prunus persica]
MPEKITPEDLLNNIVGTFAESSSKQKSVPLFGEETSNSVTSKLNRLFGRQKPVHHLLGGGKSADVLLWRNKKISASVLTGATVTWVLFEWLNYHFLTLVGFALVLLMLAQFLWSNFSGIISRSPSEVPRLVVPDQLFVNIAISIGHEINRALEFIQDVALGGNLKQFLMVLLLLTHCQFCTRDTKIRSTTLHTRSLGSFNIIIGSSIPVSSAGSQKERSIGRSMIRYV